MKTARFDTYISPKLIVVSVLFTLLISCSNNAPMVKNQTHVTQPKINWSGAFIHGSSNDVIGLV